MIKVIQEEVLKAFEAVCKLSRLILPKQKAHELYDLKLLLKKQYDFEIEQELLIIENLGGTVLPDNSVKYSDDPTEQKAKEDEFRRQKKELYEVELELDFTPLDFTSVPIQVSADDEGALRPFIHFV